MRTVRPIAAGATSMSGTAVLVLEAPDQEQVQDAFEDRHDEGDRDEGQAHLAERGG